MTELIVLGLDGATFEIIKPMIRKDKLPNFKRLMEEGTSGKLRSTKIPISPSAWSSFLTGNGPGNHGIFDFVKRKEGSYEHVPVNATDRKGTTIWEVLEGEGKKCGLFNIPCTYPPEEVEGFMISGFPVPEGREFIYPENLHNELNKRFKEIKLQPDVFYTEGNEKKFIEDQYECWESTEKIFNYLWKNEECDVLIGVFKPTDEMFHGMWKSIDQNHPDHEENKKYKEKVLGVYRKADELIGKVLAKKDEDTDLILMSDHGFGPVHSTLYMNNWLLKEGYMKFKDDFGTKLKKVFHRLGFNLESAFNLGKRLGLMKFAKKVAYSQNGESLLGKIKDRLFLSFDDVDWKKTKAYSSGNFGQIYINKKEREPEGIVGEEEYEDLVEEIASKLKDVKDPRTNEKIFDEIKIRDEIYSGKYMEEAPDIVFFDENFEYTANRMFEFGSNKIVGENVIDRSGDHKPFGVFFAHGSNFREDGKIKNAEIIDLLPTILYSLKCPIPQSLDGEILKNIFTKEFKEENEPEFRNFEKAEEEPEKYTEKEKDEIKERLKKTGYLG